MRVLRRRSRLLTWTLLLVATANLPSTRAQERPTRSDRSISADPRAAVEAIAPLVARLRGLEFERPVPVEVVDDARARRYVLDRLESFDLGAQIEAAAKAYELLGLVPPDTDVVEQVLETLREQAGGFYDPERKVFYLLGDLPQAAAPLVIAHELTHALEDQHYDLDARLRLVVENDDQAFALSAVHEGTATLLMSLYLAQGVAEGTLSTNALAGIDETFGAAASVETLATPLLRQLFGPYILGPAFLMHGSSAEPGVEFPVARAGRAMRDGPRSSEQVLHPEKFWDAERIDEPREVRFDDAAAELGKGWKLRGAGVLGELVLAPLVGAETSLDPAKLASGGAAAAWTNAAATGWDGDRWELWTRRGASLLLVLTVWDSAADADEFAAALPRRSTLAWRSAGARVALIAGRPPKQADALLERMLAAPNLVPPESPR